MVGKHLFNPIELNNEFKIKFNSYNWNENRYQYYITLNRDPMEKSLSD